MKQESKKEKVLLVEDDPNLGMLLREYLDAKGYETQLAVNGKQGYDKFISGDFDICLLDVMMPVKDGFTLAEEIRKTDKEVPIVFLTAKSQKEDRITGFNKGADDYITKPFSMEELLLRMKAIMRRIYPDSGKDRPNQILQLGNYIFDYHHQLLIYKDEKIKLTTKENELMHQLVTNVNDVTDRNYALNKIWGNDNYFNARSMDVYIAKLRKHLSKDKSMEIINVHGRGFKLMAKVQKVAG